MAKRAVRTQPALTGNLSASKRAIVTRDGVYVLDGREWGFLSWREVEAIVGLRQEFQAARAVELEEQTS